MKVKRFMHSVRDIYVNYIKSLLCGIDELGIRHFDGWWTRVKLSMCAGQCPPPQCKHAPINEPMLPHTCDLDGSHFLLGNRSLLTL